MCVHQVQEGVKLTIQDQYSNQPLPGVTNIWKAAVIKAKRNASHQRVPRRRKRARKREVKKGKANQRDTSGWRNSSNDLQARCLLF